MPDLYKGLVKRAYSLIEHLAFSIHHSSQYAFILSKKAATGLNLPIAGSSNPRNPLIRMYPEPAGGKGPSPALVSVCPGGMITSSKNHTDHEKANPIRTRNRPAGKRL